MELNDESLMKKASMTSHFYLVKAIKSVDKIFKEEGAHKKYPEIVASLVHASSMDFLASAINKSNGIGLMNVSDSIRAVADQLE